jgi:DNA-binding transcriptional regulator YiaG
MKRTSQARIMLRALGLSQEEFAARFHIPLGALRDWEQGRRDPDTAARRDRSLAAADAVNNTEVDTDDSQ